MSNSLLAINSQDDPTFLVPNGWHHNQLGKTCDIYGGGRLGLTKEKHYRSSGVLAFSAAGPDGFVEQTEFQDKAGVVLSAIGANCGRCFFAFGDWTTLANVQAIIPNSEVDAKYLFYVVNRDGYWERSGSAQPFIKPSTIRSSWVVYPRHIREQTKIAEILSTVDQALEQTGALIAKQQRIKTGLMRDLLTRGIDKDGNLRSEDTHEFKDSPLGRIPVEWESGYFQSCISGSPKNGIYKPQSAYGERGTPIIRIDGFGHGDRIKAQSHKRIGLSKSEIDQFRLRDGEILINRVNSIQYLGKTALVEHLPEATVFESNMMRLTIDQQRMLPDFALLILTSPAASGHFLSNAKLAIAQASINQNDVNSLWIQCPHLEEQRVICERIAAIDGFIRNTVSGLEKLHRTKTALMQDLLTGHVSVTPLLTEADVYE